jgi:hypothetical protein
MIGRLHRPYGGPSLEQRGRSWRWRQSGGTSPARNPRTRRRASQSRGGLSARCIIFIEWIGSVGPNVQRDLAHDLNDLGYDIALVTPGNALEQMSDRRGDRHFRVFVVDKFPSS